MLYIDLPHAFIATTSLWADILPNTKSIPVSMPIGRAYGITPGMRRATMYRKNPMLSRPAARSPTTSFMTLPSTSTKTKSATVRNAAPATCFRMYLLSVPIG